MGPSAFDRYVEKLSDFISRTGAKVYDHYDTILRWWSEDRQNAQSSSQGGRRNKAEQYQTHDAELSDLEKQAIQRALEEGAE